MLMFLTIVIAVAVTVWLLRSQARWKIIVGRVLLGVLGLILGVVVLAFVIWGLAAPS